MGRPFPSKEIRRISERDDPGPPVVPGGKGIALGSRTLERARKEPKKSLSEAQSHDKWLKYLDKIKYERGEAAVRWFEPKMDAIRNAFLAHVTFGEELFSVF